MPLKPLENHGRNLWKSPQAASFELIWRGPEELKVMLKDYSKHRFNQDVQPTEEDLSLKVLKPSLSHFKGLQMSRFPNKVI